MFKKMLCFALTLIVICSCSLTAFADMEGPYFEEFEITVDNPDGIELYDSNWDISTNKTTMKKIAVIPNGTKLTITGDYMAGGVSYLYATYGDKYGYIKASDVRIDNKDVVKPTKDDKVDEKFSVITINPDGAKLRSGPSNAHPEVTTVPAGTEFDIEYVIGGWGAWAYVTYNGTSGWLHFYEYGDSYDCIDLKEKPGKAMVVNNSTYLTKTPDTNSPKVSEAIPYGTVFNYTHIYHEAKADIAYVEYNGIKGWLRTRDAFAQGAAHYSNDPIVINNPDGLNVYSDIKDSDKVICTIPYNTVIPAGYEIYNDYAQDSEVCCYVYISYNGINGWLRLMNWSDTESTDSTPASEKNDDNALPAPSIFSIKDTEKVTEKTTEETSVSATAQAETQPTDNTVAEKTVSPQMLIILCVAAAAVGAVTAAVIIVIVIKKRKR